MKRPALVVAMVSLLVLLLSACSKDGGGEPATATPAAATTTAADGMDDMGDMAMIDIPLPEAGKDTVSEAANLEVGQTLMVTLGSNPTTGYEWTVTGEPDAAVLEKTSDSMSPAASPMPGAPGSQIFEFKAVAAGDTSIELTYARPFGDEGPAQVVTINVGVA